MPHFHLPLQSGNDGILKAMRRRYDSAQYRKTIRRIIEAFPSSAIGADVICGFPRETEQQFFDTYRLIEESPLSHLHVFPYSPRGGTLASRMDGQVPPPEKKIRASRLRALGEKKMAAFTRTQLGQHSQVLFEYRDGGGRWWGYTPNYLRSAVLSDRGLKNKILSVEHYGIVGDRLASRLLSHSTN